MVTDERLRELRDEFHPTPRLRWFRPLFGSDNDWVLQQLCADGNDRRNWEWREVPRERAEGVVSVNELPWPSEEEIAQIIEQNPPVSHLKENWMTTDERSREAARKILAFFKARGFTRKAC